MGDKRNLSGVWYGRYTGDYCGQDNGFIAVLEEQGGAFDGSISEPDDKRGTGTRHADVSGRRSGNRLAFVKQYDGSGGFTHAVRYAGRVNDEGTEVSGAWAAGWLTGRFVMEREKFSAEELEDTAEVEIVEPVGR
jgi:hypothetical protein